MAVAGFVRSGPHDDGVPRHCFTFDGSLPVFTAHPDGGSTFAQLDVMTLKRYTAAIESGLGSVVDRLSPAVIHANHFWLFALSAARTGRPVIVTIHGSELPYLGDPRWREKLMPLTRAPNVTLLANSRYTADQLRQQLQTNVAVEVLPFGPPATMIREGPAPRTCMVLFCGKLTQIKEVDVLLRAAAIYESRLPEVRTVICGDGPEGVALRHLAENLELKGCIFRGTIPHDEVVELMWEAAVYVSPCRVEGLGLAPLEACSQGVPVIAAAGGAHLETIHSSEMGALFEPGDSRSLASQVIAAISTGWRGRMADACRNTIRGPFNIERHVAALLSRYRQIT